MKKVVAHIIKNNLNEILLQKRTADYKRFPSKWTLFGGAVEQGETPYLAAKRELIEELGLVEKVNYLGEKVVNFDDGQMEELKQFLINKL